MHIPGLIVKLIIVIPTYNEADNLPQMTTALFGLPFADMHLIIVDDNSPDGTGQVADGLCAQYSDHMTVIHRSGKMGLGSAYAQGFQVALEMGADVIVQMDADFSHSPDYLPEMVRQLEKYDAVVGSRFVAGGSTDERWSWWRFLLSWWANQVYTRLILGVPVKDATAGFKAFRRRTLEAIDWTAVISNGYVFQVEIAYLCHKLGLRVLELPIYFEDRRIGQSKMDVPIKIEAVWRVWQIRRRYRRVKPLAVDN
ncbi:MAG: polyprenol monophosphomannose synthase [Ardenticatenaceae bacterium]|nr:polyprenol monophosphomannose synthase [Ardenticatenaceae bacterium]MCB9446293.1 polyprenol monophosphomannose synthase [Ardenticatenaceae bacterium]